MTQEILTLDSCRWLWTEERKYETPTIDELFEWLSKQHEYEYTESQKLSALLATLPPGEEREWALSQNLYYGTRMMLLRDLGRFVVGIDEEDDGNPFGYPG